MATRLKTSDLSASIGEKLTRQDYSAKKSIDGVAVKTLSPFVDDAGSFVEIGRVGTKDIFAEFPGFTVRQVNWSVLERGYVKGAHLHLNQEDVWFVPSTSTLLVGLKDLRAGSRTEGLAQRLVLGGGKGHLLFIPRGVAHGCKALSPAAEIVYFVNQYFSPDARVSDEYRLPIEIFGERFFEYTPN